MLLPDKFVYLDDGTTGQLDDGTTRQTKIIVVQQTISGDHGWSFICFLVGVYACIIGFMNTHNACYMDTGIGKLNLTIMLLLPGFLLAIGGILEIYGNSYNKKSNIGEGCVYLFLLIWQIMYAVIIFRDNSTCRADSPLFYWTALGVWIFVWVDLCLIGNRERKVYTLKSK